MRTTIKDVAKAANVSYSTVSRALAGHSQIPEKTRKRILKIADEMGYVPNNIAKSLVTKSTHTLGLVVSDITNLFFLETMEGIEECAANYGYKVCFCNSNWDVDKEIECMNGLYESSVDGVLIFPVSGNVDHLIKYQELFPMVFLNSIPENENCTYVSFDNYNNMSMIMEYLIGLGHKDIAYIGGFKINHPNSERLRGYYDILGRHGIDVNKDYILYGDFKLKSGYELMQELIRKGGKLPTAVVAGNDVMAIGIIQAIEEHGLRVPQDISVVGFDDISYSSLDKIQLTTVSTSRYVLGKTSVELLVDKIKNPKKKESISKLLGAELVIRKTCSNV